MILSAPMKRGLELVRIFNGLNREQLLFLLRKEFPARHANRDIDRLLQMKLIMKKEDGALYVFDTEVNPLLREAARIFKAFWNKNIIGFNSGSYPVLIWFSKLIRNTVCNFYICSADNISDLRIHEKNAIVIAIADVDNREQTERRLAEYPLCCQVLIAVKEYGEYKFYKTGGKQ